MSNTIFAERFRRALQLSGLQQKEVARLLGVHPSNITRYKAGAYVPDNLEDIAKIAKALGVSPAWLAGLTDDEEIIEPSEKDLAHNKIETYISEMSPEQVKKVQKFIEDYIL